MDILDIFLDILLKHLSPYGAIFYFSAYASVYAEQVEGDLQAYASVGF